MDIHVSINTTLFFIDQFMDISHIHEFLSNKFMDFSCIHNQQYQQHHAQINNPNLYIYIYIQNHKQHQQQQSHFNSSYVVSLLFNNSHHSNDGAYKTTLHVGPSNPILWHCFTWRPIHVDLICYATRTLATQQH